jgi:cytochrome c oxidase cbb3-type subunit I/II
MPVYPGLMTGTIDWPAVQKHVDGMAMLGVPYGDLVQDGKAIADAKAQATAIGDDIAATGGPANLQDKEMVALVAYLQRLGTDIKKAGPVAQRSPLLGGL